MATLLDNRTLMIVIALAALWYFYGRSQAEGMDAQVYVTQDGTQVSVNQQQVASIPASQPASVVINSQPVTFSGGQSNIVGGYSSTEAVSSGAPVGSVPPAPLTAVTSESLFAAVPPGMQNTGAESPFTAEATNMDDLFERQDDLDPAELIPKDLPDIYGDYKADPTLAGNMLMQSYALGIDTSAAKRSWVADIRKIYNVPQAVVSPWLNSSRLPTDTSRRSLSEIE